MGSDISTPLKIMGASSSVSTSELFPERPTVGTSVEPWLSAEDIVELSQAKTEITRIRKLA